MRLGRRDLVLSCAGLVLAAVALWASASLTWYRVTAQLPLRGPVPVTFTGGQVRPALVGLAAVALAGVAAALALAGLMRRVLGGLLALAGVAMAATSLLAALGPSPFATDAVPPDFPAPPPGVPVDALRYQPAVVGAAPWVALAGAVALAAAGVWLALRERRLPRFGARFAAPSERRRAPDQDRSWWDALDHGRDPTSSDGAGTDPRPAG